MSNLYSIPILQYREKLVKVVLLIACPTVASQVKFLLACATAASQEKFLLSHPPVEVVMYPLHPGVSISPK